MILRIYLLAIILLLAFTPNIKAKQTAGKKNKFNAGKKIKTADKMLAEGNIYSAVDIYEEVLEHQPADISTMYKLAEGSRLARDYKKAEIYYAKVSEAGLDKFPLSNYYDALMLKMNGKYEESKKTFQDFSKTYKGENADTFKKWAENEAEGCDLALSLLGKSATIKIQHLDTNVNSAYGEASPVLWDDSTLLFGSLLSDSLIILEDKRESHDHFIKFYQSHFNQDSYAKGEMLPLFNVAGSHTGNGAFSPDRKRFYFTRCNEGNQGMICEIYVSKLDDTNAWSKPVKLESTINAAGSNNTHPMVTENKGTEILYFSSNRSGGSGGMDIWYSKIKNDSYEAPRNAGSKINTDKDEITPFYNALSETLYFSSNGLVNVGGFDIFKSKGNESSWETPVNMGFPLNSSADDLYYHWGSDSTAGYFVSNRPGVFSIRSETCCDDIFAFKKPEIHFAVQGFIYDDITKKPVGNSRVVLANIENPDEVQEFFTKEDEPYFFKLEPNQAYRVTSSAQGYDIAYAEMETKGITTGDTLQAEIYLKKHEENKSYNLENTYYDYNKWELTGRSTTTLDNLYKWLIENPTVIIRISSHTDSRGSDSFNMTLSRKRAESCVNYLVKRGISKERLVANGYGESRPIEDCTKYKECPDDDIGDCTCYQRNRRTEFEIIGDTEKK